MIGSRLTEAATGATFGVTGQREGRYVIQRVDAHEPPQEVTAADLAARFQIDAPDPLPEADEQAGWEVLADANAQAALRLAGGDVPDAPTPEEALAAHEDA